MVELTRTSYLQVKRLLAQKTKLEEVLAMEDMKIYVSDNPRSGIHRRGDADLDELAIPGLRRFLREKLDDVLEQLAAVGYVDGA